MIKNIFYGLAVGLVACSANAGPSEHPQQNIDLILLQQSLTALHQVAPVQTGANVLAPTPANIPDAPPLIPPAPTLTPSNIPDAPPLTPPAPSSVPVAPPMAPPLTPPTPGKPAAPTQRQKPSVKPSGPSTGPSVADLKSGISGLKPAKDRPAAKPQEAKPLTLLEEIKKGKDLKKADDRKLAEPAVKLTPAEIERNKKIKEETEQREKRRAAIAGEDDDSDSDDDWAN